MASWNLPAVVEGGAVVPVAMGVDQEGAQARGGKGGKGGKGQHRSGPKRSRARGPSGDQEGGGEEDEEEEELNAAGVTMSHFLVILKLCHSLAARVRSLEAAIWDTYLLPRSHVVIIHMLKASKEYAAAVAGLGGDHKFGPPQLHTSKAMLIAIASMTEQSIVYGTVKMPAQLAPTVALVAGYVAKLQTMELNNVCMEFNICCQSTCAGFPGKQEKNKLFLGLDPTVALMMGDKSIQLRKLLANVLCNTGGERKNGRGPSGALERRVGKMIDDFKRK